MLFNDKVLVFCNLRWWVRELYFSDNLKSRKDVTFHIVSISMENWGAADMN